jgi:hypothetical protein
MGAIACHLKTSAVPLGDDGGSREDHSPLGVCTRRLYGGASNYTKGRTKMYEWGKPSRSPSRIASFKKTRLDARLDL